MVVHELVVAFRRLLRQPLISLAVVLTLGLGIGSTLAVLGVLDVLVWRALPFAEDARLSRVFQVPFDGSAQIGPRYEAFLALRDHTESFDLVVAQRLAERTMRTAEGAKRVVAIAVSEGWDELWRRPPLLGRGFSDGEWALGDDSGVFVASYAFWRRQLAGDRKALGTSIDLDGRAYDLIGVMPPGLSYPYQADIWIPFRPDLQLAASWGLNIQARRKPGVSPEQAASELQALSRGLDGYESASLVAMPIRDAMFRGMAGSVRLLFGAVAFLLLLVCSNIGSLQLTQTLARQEELALRSTLGAGRFGLARLIFLDSLLVSSIGSLIGFGLAAIGTDLLRALLPERLIELHGGVPFDLRLFLFGCALSLVAAGFISLPPTLRLLRRAPSLVGAGIRVSGGGAQRARQILVATETAMALVLLAGGGAMLRELRALERADLGYPLTGLMTAQLAIDRGPYADPSRREQVLAAIEERLEALHGVSDVGATSIFPSRRGNQFASIVVDGQALESDVPQLANHRLVTPGWLGALGLEPSMGRLIDRGDTGESQLVAVVNDAFVAKYLPHGKVIGTRVRSRLAPRTIG